MTFTRVGVIVVITAVAVYFGLNLLLPRNTAEQKAASATTPNQVFSTTADATPAPPATPADSTAAPAAAPSADQQAAAPAATAAPASSDTTTPPPAAAETAASGSSSSSAAPAQGLSEEEARKIAEEVGRKVATQVASSVVQNNQPAQPAAEATPAQAAADSSTAAGSSSSGSADQAQESAPAAAAPAETPAPATAAESAPAAAEAPAPKPKKSKHSSETASADAGTTAAPAKSPAKAHAGQKSMDAISNWWPATQSDGKLNLIYAGEAASVKAAALLFSDNIGNAAAAGSHIQILDSNGKAASGQWETSPQNARLLIFKTKPGRYTVILAPELAGLSGKTLGTGLHGPVYVH